MRKNNLCDRDRDILSSATNCRLVLCLYPFSFKKSTRKINTPILLVEVVLVVGLELHHLWAMSAVIHTHPHNQQSPVHNTQKGSKSKLDQLGHFSH